MPSLVGKTASVDAGLQGMCVASGSRGDTAHSLSTRVAPCNGALQDDGGEGKAEGGVRGCGSP